MKKINSENSAKRKYYLRNREQIISAKRKKYNDKSKEELNNLSKINKKRYKRKSLVQKAISSKIIKKKYQSLSTDDLKLLRNENRRKYANLTVAKKLRLKYNNRMRYLRNRQIISQRTLNVNECSLNLIEQYYKSIKEGPTELCECCGGLFFPKSIKGISMNHFKDNFDDEFIKQILCIPQKVNDVFYLNLILNFYNLKNNFSYVTKFISFVSHVIKISKI